MINIKYERYYNDSVRKDEEKTFADLGALAGWIFGQMQQDYTDSFTMFFPTPENSRGLRDGGPGHISFRPVRGGKDIRIHLIRNADEIIFSDGRFTAGRKHWSTPVKEWLIACDKRQHAHESNSMDDRLAMAASKDGRSTLLLHLDYGDGEYGCILYRVPAERLDEARDAAAAAWAAYDGNGRQGQVEEAFEVAFRQAGIPFACEDYAIHWITA